GSGKSTLLNMLATIDSVTAGHIYYEGKNITKFTDDERADFRKENLGFVFQEFNLLDTLTIKENIFLAMTLSNKNKHEINKRTNEIMKILEISSIKDRFPYEVSGGQRQRCACARAIINKPKIIFADEPTGALDSKSARVLLDTFTKMNVEMKATILMVTHDSFSASYCNKILFLKDGKIFHELYKGEKNRRDFLNEILDVLSLTGGDIDV
ncbi:MAG TPA: ABC transporter ATP-binding protein, partial [Gallicola sp.]|nr:ABC transporter ATP-binding protein [Gallicola sp.]